MNDLIERLYIERKKIELKEMLEMKPYEMKYYNRPKPDLEGKRVSAYKFIDTNRLCYFKMGGIWHIYHPDAGLGSLSKHNVIEFNDGTISVTPSIRIKGENEVHGYLKKGMWKDC